MPTEILCPYCGTQLEGGAVYCYRCGRGLTEGADLEEQVERGRGALAENERDRDAPFTVGPQLAAAGGTCPYCGTILEPETGNCPECAHSVLDRGEALEAKVKRALAILDLDENDTDALFTLGAYLLLDGKAQEALDTLNRLTLLDPDYPGLWRVKAQVFEKLGKKGAAAWARERA